MKRNTPKHEKPVIPDSPEPRPCGLLRRLMIMQYDALIVLALMMLAAAVALPFGQKQAGTDPLYSAYLLGVWFTYLAISWRRGMTVGMRAWRVRLQVDNPASHVRPGPLESGAKLGWVACAIRFGLCWVSAAPLGLGYLWALGDPARRTWHDRWTGTRLVRF